MATKFSQLRESMTEERQQRIRERTEELLAELTLQELRQVRALSPESQRAPE